MAAFDPTAYWTIPLLDTASTITLGTKLLRAAPKPLPRELQRPLKQVRATLLALQTAFAAQAASAAPGADKRKADAAILRAGSGHERRHEGRGLARAHPARTGGTVAGGVGHGRHRPARRG